MFAATRRSLLEAGRSGLLLGAVGAVVALALALGGAALSDAAPSQSTCSQFPPAFDGITTRAIRTARGSEMRLGLVQGRPTCGAAVRVAAADGNAEFVRLGSATKRAFRLKATNLCTLKRLSPQLDLRDTVIGPTRRATCETSLLSVAIAHVSGGTRRATRNQCVTEGILVRLGGSTARAHRDTIPITVEIRPASDLIIIDVNDGRSDVPVGIGFPDDGALLGQCHG